MRNNKIYIFIIIAIIVLVASYRTYKLEDIKKEKITTALAALNRADETKNEEDIVLAELAIEEVKTSEKEEFVSQLSNLKVEIIKENLVEDYLILIETSKKSNSLEEIEKIIKDIETIEYDDIKQSLLGSATDAKTIIEEEIERKRQEARNNRLLEIDKRPPISRVVENAVVIEKLSGTMTAYTPYCDGCRGYTASGKYVGDGDIYYNDKDYGLVRIVAGDSSYPFGTIVRIKGYGSDIYAVVLDRGGSIGKGKRAMFDLLFATKTYAYNFGIKYNLEFEILRLGY